MALAGLLTLEGGAAAPRPRGHGCELAGAGAVSPGHPWFWPRYPEGQPLWPHPFSSHLTYVPISPAPRDLRAQSCMIRAPPPRGTLSLPLE